MIKIFEFIGAVTILTFMGVVLWQTIYKTSDTVPSVACTMDAKQCPDGSAVGRSGPDCAFADCPLTDLPTEINPTPIPPISLPEPDIPTPDHPVACTMDAKQCPDGSYVGRVAPNCAFAECPVTPEVPSEMITCTPESKLAEVCAEIYAPVCGLVEIQCITTPCNPIPETFGNSCAACSQSNVNSYTEGACEQ